MYIPRLLISFGTICCGPSSTKVEWHTGEYYEARVDTRIHFHDQLADNNFGQKMTMSTNKLLIFLTGSGRSVC